MFLFLLTQMVEEIYLLITADIIYETTWVFASIFKLQKIKNG